MPKIACCRMRSSTSAAWRNMDARVSYRASHVRSNRFNLRGFALDLNLDRGLLRMNPLALELAQGRIAGAASINARETIPVSTIDVRLSNARIESASRGGVIRRSLEVCSGGRALSDVDARCVKQPRTQTVRWRL